VKSSVFADSTQRVLFFVDFDGTAAQEIASARLLERFAHGDWEEYDRLLEAGKISFRECVVKQYSMLVGTREAMKEYCCRELQLRAGFMEFVQYIQTRGWEIRIVSEALDFLIEAILEREGLQDLTVYCDRAVFHDNKVTVELPYLREDCPCQVGNCKMAHLRAARACYDTIVYIGDGSNDFCPAREADLVFARRRLAQLCEESRTPFFAFEDFHEIWRILKRLEV
jgi:2,3-diketo-5-methylthio-1-phosphopentane phosphatase